ncbi:MAG: DUF1080 domain-containing protein [Planctomycetales bacterium]|nr:DUF1080 domain-containing protein [Planctomycetales bacterium]
MKYLLAVILVMTGFRSSQAQTLGADTDYSSGEWTQMFDGKSLSGWKVSKENPESWQVEDGMLVTKGPRAHLFYIADKQPYKDFHFTCEVKTTPGSNAGIYFHTRYQEEGWPKFGYECQVNVSHTDVKKSSSLYDIQNVADPGLKDNEWYTQEIVVQANRIQLKVNGRTLVDYEQPVNQPAFSEKFERRLGEGTIALQAHDPDSVVYFRNLRIKRL